MHEGTGWCEGCLRTLDEIALWAALTDVVKRAIWRELSQRRIVWRQMRRPAAET